MGGVMSYFRGLFGSREMRILILGLDGAGKTTLLYRLQEDELKSAILVVLANKQDIEGAMSVTEVHQALGLEALKNRTFQIFKASAIQGQGLDEAMEWLSNSLQTKK
eukprot:maker-scaffold22_size673200-snap-gene-1.15 protein:Tk12664 transcript:maker-scaffold22_size673200-snap-gene-1.15-mRNA-1 annotation:"adp-ribosylation arf"